MEPSPTTPDTVRRHEKKVYQTNITVDGKNYTCIIDLEEKKFTIEELWGQWQGPKCSMNISNFLTSGGDTSSLITFAKEQCAFDDKDDKLHKFLKAVYKSTQPPTAVPMKPLGEAFAPRPRWPGFT